jgi:hypothetical protein
VNDCTLASGEGHSSHGETFHLLYTASPVSAERTVVSEHVDLMLSENGQLTETLKAINIYSLNPTGWC